MISRCWFIVNRVSKRSLAVGNMPKPKGQKPKGAKDTEVRC